MNKQRIAVVMAIAIFLSGIAVVAAVAGGRPGQLAVQASSDTGTVPGKPTELVGASSEDGMRLTWSEPSGDVTGYQILRRRPYECERTLMIYEEDTGNTDTSYIDADVDVGVRYAYRVKAINDDAIGPRSNFTSVVYTPGSSLRKVGSLGRPVDLEATGTRRGIELAWDPPAANADDVTGYQILRRRPKECEGSLRIIADNTNSTDTTYIDEDVTGGTLYSYRVKAINDRGPGRLSNNVRQERGIATEIMMIVMGKNAEILSGGRDEFQITINHMHYDDDASTVDYVLRGDAYQVADDGTETDADVCEMAGLGHDVDITVVDESAEEFNATFGGSTCPAGDYVVNLRLREADDEDDLMSLPVAFEMQ